MSRFAGGKPASARRYYLKNRAKLRAAGNARYHATKDERRQHLRELWRKQNRRKWETNRDKMLARAKSEWKKYINRPGKKELVRATQARYYAANKERISKRNTVRYFEEKVERILGEDISFTCERSCGRETMHPTGICRFCRTVECRKCTKPLIQEIIGQRLHEKCKPRSEGMFDGI